MTGRGAVDNFCGDQPDFGTVVGMPRSRPLPEESHGHAFLTSDRGAYGLTRGRLRGIDVEHPFHGVSAIDVDPAEIDSRCSTYLPLMAPGQFFSHVTAAALFGMPLPLFLIREEPIHVAVLGSATRPRTRGIVGHGLSAADVTTCLIRGFPAVSPADTWCHLGSVLSKEDLVAAGDYLISGARAEWGRMPALARIEELTAARIRHRGRRGARRVTWALERLRSPVDSRPESLLRLLLVAAGTPSRWSTIRRWSTVVRRCTQI